MADGAAAPPAAVFLDRDGVLNRAVERDGKPYAPTTADELIVIDGAAAACERLRAAGYRLVVVTNQPEVARGTLDPGQLEVMHDRLRAETGVDEVRVCPHDDRDGCACRKPRPGMLLTATSDLGLDLTRSWMVGDRWRDVAAGQAAGVRCVFVDNGWDEQRPTGEFAEVADVAAAADHILATGSHLESRP